MSSISHPLIKGNFLTRYLESSFSELLPRRFKRIMYVGTALGLIIRQKKPDIKLVMKMNQVLHLAYSEDALLFPVYISSLVWRDIRSNVIHLVHGNVQIGHISYHDLSDDDCFKVGKYIANNSPSWLHYGSQETMVADIYYMLQELRRAA